MFYALAEVGGRPVSVRICDRLAADAAAWFRQQETNFADSGRTDAEEDLEIESGLDAAGLSKAMQSLGWRVVEPDIYGDRRWALWANGVIEQPGIYQCANGHYCAIDGHDGFHWVADFGGVIDHYRCDGTREMRISSPDPWQIVRCVSATPDGPPIEVRAGWWRTRGGDLLEIMPTEAWKTGPIGDGYIWESVRYEWTYQANGRLSKGCVSLNDLVEWVGLDPEGNRYQREE